MREPQHIASDVATLDVVCGGRARLGLGAGHTPAEWRAVGRERPGVAERVERCMQVTRAVQALLAEVRWTTAVLDEQVGLVTEGAAGRPQLPGLEALVQQVTVTDDAEAAAAELAAHAGVSPSELLALPYVLMGTADEMVEAVTGHHRRWGIARYVIRASAMDAVAPLLRRLAAIG